MLKALCELWIQRSSATHAYRESEVRFVPGDS
jgi:hypothetical protein